MKIYAEYLILLFLIFIFFMWVIVSAMSKRRSLKKYNPDNDKGKIGESRRREAIKRDEERELDSARPSQVEKQRVLQTADVSSIRKNSRGSRKVSKSPRGIFRRTRRRR